MTRSFTLYHVSNRTAVSQSYFSSTCETCGFPATVLWPDIIPVYQSLCSSLDSSARRPSLHALVLSDCANVIANLPQGNAKCRDKTNRLVCNHIRDLQAFTSVSYNSAPLNLPDVGAQLHGNVSVFNRFISTGSFLSDSSRALNVKISPRLIFALRNVFVILCICLSLWRQKSKKMTSV